MFGQLPERIQVEQTSPYLVLMASQKFLPLELPRTAAPPLPSAQTIQREACARQIKIKNPKLCLVCGNEGRCVNYNAFTCQACRAFFRRHGLRSTRVQTCPLRGRCELNFQSRIQKACIACRLSKCISVGMSAPSTTSETQKPITPLPRLDLLNHHRVDLTERDWMLLSNILHAYDTFHSIPSICDLMNRSSISQQSESQRRLPVVEHGTAAMRSFVSSIPDFQILTADEQSSLLKRNWQAITGLSVLLVLRDSPAFDSPECTSNAIEVYGTEVVQRARRIRSRLDPDSALSKLMLVVHTFSSNCLIVEVPRSKQNDSLILGTFRLMGSQNVFVELVWKYMTYRYGYRDTVIRFASLVKQMLDMSSHLADSYLTSQAHHQFVNEMVGEGKQIVSNNSNSYVPLWGHF